MANKVQKPGVGADCKVKICPRCERVWEKDYSKNKILYYKNFPSYGKSRKVCGECVDKDSHLAIKGSFNDYGYMIELWDGNSFVDELYRAGNHKFDSWQVVQKKHALPKNTLKQWCKDTCQEFADYHGYKFIGVEEYD